MQFIATAFKLNLKNELVEIYLCYLIPESGSISAPASTVSVSAGQQQQVNVSVMKEVVVNGENGYSEGNNKKQRSSHEERDLQEWYRACSHSHLD